MCHRGADVPTEGRKVTTNSAEQPGYVYYLRVGDLVKLGYSANPRERLRQYPPGSVLLALEPATPALERVRLDQFAESLLWGNEWFASTPELEAHIRKMKSTHGLTNYMQPTYGVGGATGRKDIAVPSQASQWLTIAGAATSIGVSTKTIRRWIASGLVEADRMGPKLIRVKAASLDKLGRSLQYVD